MTTHTNKKHLVKQQQKLLTTRKLILLGCGLVLLFTLGLLSSLMKNSNNQSANANYYNPAYPYYLETDFEICGEPDKDNNNNGVQNYLELSVDSNGNGIPNCNDTSYTQEFLKQITNK